MTPPNTIETNEPKSIPSASFQSPLSNEVEGSPMTDVIDFDACRTAKNDDVLIQAALLDNVSVEDVGDTAETNEAMNNSTTKMNDDEKAVAKVDEVGVE